MKTSIIIPVFNEEATIAQVIEKVSALDIDKEIIVVNDGSSDGTVAALRQYEGVDGMVVHDSRINSGKGAALRAGITHATGDIVIFQDADLELRPEQIPELIAVFEDPEVQAVYGSRFLNKVEGLSLVNLAANKFLSMLTSALYGTRITDMETCYKACRTSVLKSLDLRARGFEVEPEITAKLLLGGYRIHECAIDYRPRGADEGKKIGWKDGVKAVYYLVKYRVS
jgi:dolichol-phosphate mannosyltransferase